MPRTSKVGLVQPMHARSYSAGINLRLVKSPVPPKITKRQEPALGNVGTVILNDAGCTAVLTSYLLLVWEILGRAPPNRRGRNRLPDDRRAEKYATQRSRAALESSFAAVARCGSCQSTTARPRAQELEFP